MADQVQTVTRQLGGPGGPGTWVTTFQWRADAAGAVVATAANDMIPLAGFIIRQVEFEPLSPAPTDGYAATVTDLAGFDILNGAASSLGTASPSSFAVSSAASPLNGVLTLNISGQSVPYAQGRVYVYLMNPDILNISSGGGGSSGNPAGTNGQLQYNNQGSFGAITSGSFGNLLTSYGSGVVPHFVAPLQINAALYNFSPLTPGGTCTGGVSKTITFSPSMRCPQGVNGSDALHYVYLSGGTGTAEAVLITGGTAVSGGTSGTLIFTPANNHSGAWTITSATGGIMEAVTAIGAAAAGTVFITTTATLYAPINVLSGQVLTLQGQGQRAYAMSRGSGFISGSMISNTQSNASCTVRDMTINQGTGATTGIGITFNGSDNNNIFNVLVYNGNVGIALIDAIETHIDQVIVGLYDQTFKAIAGLSISGGSVNTYISNSAFGGSPDTANLAYYGILISEADGVWASNTGALADASLFITAPSGFTANVHFVNGLFDGFRTYGVLIQNGSIGNIQFDNCHLDGQGQNGWSASGPAFAVGYGATTAYTNISWVGGFIGGCNGVGAYLGASSVTGGKIKMTGVDVSANNRSNIAGAAGIEIGNGASVVIVGCDSHNTGAVFGGHQKYGIAIDNTVHDSTIVGNNLGSVAEGTIETAPLVSLAGGAITRTVIGQNTGVDDAIGSVANAATIAFPFNPDFIITGSGTTITQCVMTNVPAGSSGTFRTTDGALSFTATGVIGNAGTTTQNVPAVWSWDGTNLWIKY